MMTAGEEAVLAEVAMMAAPPNLLVIFALGLAAWVPVVAVLAAFGR